MSTESVLRTQLVRPVAAALVVMIVAAGCSSDGGNDPGGINGPARVDPDLEVGNNDESGG